MIKQWKYLFKAVYIPQQYMAIFYSTAYCYVTFDLIKSIKKIEEIEHK